MNEFKSTLAPFFVSYVEFKRSLGYKIRYTYVLMNLDNFLSDCSYELIGLSEAIISKWCERRTNESEVTWYKRIVEVKNFSAYLNELGYPSFVPRLPKRYRSTFTPYIFSQEELKRFFISCDQLQYKPCFQSNYHTLSPLFRLLYGSGLRISEALSLKYEDVDLCGGCITIHETKNGEERQLPLSDTLKEVLEQYVRQHRQNAMKNEFFFIKQNGQQCTCNSIYKNFRKILFNAGISHGGKGNGPRVHDLRHTFSVHSLAQMAQNGLDLYYCLPLLSKYLGHKSLAATDSYVRLTAEIYPQLIGDVNRICAFIFPQISQGETK